MEGKEVKIHLYTQSEPIVRKNVRNTYQKGDMFCVLLVGNKKVHKYPLQHIYEITETDIDEKPEDKT